jgi:hypothetical protein
MSNDHDDVDLTPPPGSPSAELARATWQKVVGVESTVSRYRQHLFGSKETGPGWTHRMEERMNRVEIDVAAQKFLSWKILAASTVGGAFAALLMNLLKLI